MAIPDGVDWPQLLRELRIVAHRVGRALSDCDLSEEDLVQETLVRLFMRPEPFDPDIGTLKTLCKGIMRYVVFESLRDRRRRAGSLDDQDFAVAHSADPAFSRDPRRGYEAALLAKDVRRHCAGRDKLIALVDVLPDVDFTKHNRNQQIADLLSEGSGEQISVADVINRLRMLRRMVNVLLSERSGAQISVADVMNGLRMRRRRVNVRK